MPEGWSGNLTISKKRFAVFNGLARIGLFGDIRVNHTVSANLLLVGHRRPLADQGNSSVEMTWFQLIDHRIVFTKTNNGIGSDLDPLVKNGQVNNCPFSDNTVFKKDRIFSIGINILIKFANIKRLKISI